MPLINKEPKRMGNIVVTEFVDSVGTDEVTFTFPNSTEQDTFQLYNISPKELVVTVGTQTQNVPAYQGIKIEAAYTSFKIKSLSGVGGFRVTCSYQDSDEEDEVILGNRINQLTSQLAENMQEQKKYDYVDYLSKSANLSRKMTVKMDNPTYKYFYVNIPTSDVDGIVYLFGKDTNDDYQLLLNADYGDLIQTSAITESKNPETELMGGTTDKGFPPNYWTATVDNWIAATFVGTKIAFNSFCDNRGGLWRFILDEGTAGQQQIDISVYSATNVTIKQQVLFQNLSSGKHTIKGVFKGQDPANPVGSPRGWWYFGGTQAQYTTRTFDIYNDTSYVNKTIDCMYGYTVKEFALSCRPFGTAEAFTYIPEHTAPTAFKIDDPILLLDGKVPIWKTGNIYTDVECVQLIQKLKGVHPSDIANPLMEITIIQTIKKGIYSVSGRVKFLRKTEIDFGYALMLGYSTILAKKIKTGFGDVRTVKTDGSKETFLNGDKETSYCVVNDVETGGKESLAIAMTIDNAYNTNRVDKPFKGDPSWVEHRNTSMGKIYTQQFKNAVIEAGEEFRFDGRYMVCKILNVNKYVL